MIESIKILPDSLYVKFKNKLEDNFLNLWLRDNAKDEKNWDYRSNQRKTYTASLSPKLFIKEASIIDNGKYIKILWSDSKKAIRYSTEFLSNNSLKKIIFNHKNILWKKKDISNQVFLNYNDILSKKGFKFFLKNLYDIGFCVIKNCKTQIETVESIANKIGYVRNSIFGGLWNFESNEDMADSAYTQEELRPHTDSTYSIDAPGLQLLLCCDYKAKGGESIMVDGFNIAKVIKNDDTNYWSGWGLINYDADNASTAWTNHYIYVDSPNTTSTITYRFMIQSASVAARSIYLNRTQASAGQAGYENAVSQAMLTEILVV
mgnify:CR=1 FL=1